MADNMYFKGKNGEVYTIPTDEAVRLAKMYPSNEPVVTIADREEGRTPTHSTHTVTIYDRPIHTVVTHTPSIVDKYISETISINYPTLHRLVVGLDIEWRPSFQRGNSVQPPVATLQLCDGHRCLIFQLIHAPYIPPSLVDFLNNPSFKFVGVGIQEDVAKIWDQYGLRVANTVDLRDLAFKVYGDPQLKRAGLMSLATTVLGMDIDKPKKVTLSRWDKKCLDDDQIQYACADAFFSFEVGMKLMCH